MRTDPLVYAYLFFWRFRRPLKDLQVQELVDAKIYGIASLHELGSEEVVAFKEQQAKTHPRISKDVVPGYVQKLTDGYEYRVYGRAPLEASPEAPPPPHQAHRLGHG